MSCHMQLLKGGETDYLIGRAPTTSPNFSLDVTCFSYGP